MADLLGYAASCAVLATFLMRAMAPLRLMAILSNILFLAFGYLQHIYPIFFLHMALLPINAWRLAAVRDGSGSQSLIFPPRPESRDGSRPYVFWFAIGLLAGMIGSFAVIVMANES
jgi:hypothetical protein